MKLTKEEFLNWVKDVASAGDMQYRVISTRPDVIEAFREHDVELGRFMGQIHMARKAEVKLHLEMKAYLQKRLKG